MTKILIIDDEEDVCKYIKLVVKSEWPACKVISANGPISAEEKLKDRGIALIICDDKMPNITGAQILSANKANVGQTKIIMLSCSDDIEKTGRELKRQGFNIVEAIQKPVYPNGLRQLFDLHLND